MVVKLKLGTMEAVAENCERILQWLRRGRRRMKVERAEWNTAILDHKHVSIQQNAWFSCVRWKSRLTTMAATLMPGGCGSPPRASRVNATHVCYELTSLQCSAATGGTFDKCVIL